MRQKQSLDAALYLLVLAGASCGTSAQPAPPEPASQVESDVVFLASQALGGRKAGTDGSRRAAVFLATRYANLGMPGAFQSRCPGPNPCPDAYFQPFQWGDSRGHNVGARLPGADSARRGTWIVIGAHFDHLGTDSARALDYQLGAVLRPGADDNASGTAGVLALAERLSRRPPPHSVLFVHFDAEEAGLIGSSAFMIESPVSKDSIVLMINLDMVGRLRGKPLGVELTAEARGYRAVFDSMAKASGFALSIADRNSGRSDHASFAKEGIPALHLYTGYHSDYHKSSDVASRIDYAGIERVVDLVERLARVAGRR